MVTAKKKVKENKKIKSNKSKQTKKEQPKPKKESIHENKYTNTFTVDFNIKELNKIVPYVIGIEKPNIIIKKVGKELSYEDSKNEDYIHILCINDSNNLVNSLIHNINKGIIKNNFNIIIGVYKIPGETLNEMWQLNNCELTYVNNGFLNYFDANISTINLEINYKSYKHILM